MNGTAPRGAPREVLLAFARLGLVSFGGPVAHIGYFRTEFVERRRWLGVEAYADLVGLCQFLPGPASSQVGFAIGLMRGGPWGGLAAWAGFTLPSVILLLAFAVLAPDLARSSTGGAVLHGLRLVAVAVVAQAVWGMARSLCPDRRRAAIALLALALASLAPSAAGQVTAILAGGLLGLAACRASASAAQSAFPVPVSRRAGLGCLALFAVLLLVPPLFPGLAFQVFDAFYRSGALVFGGGHVVLPLLRDAVVRPGWLPDASFLDGYGAAQAVPGPLFTFAAFLGFRLHAGLGGLPGAAVALLGIFLPGLLLITGALPFWAALRSGVRAQAALRGVNAAVVGILAAALYDPVWTGGIAAPADFVIAATSFLLLTLWRCPAWAIVLLDAGAALAIA